MSSKRRSGAAGLPAESAATPDPKRRKRNDDSNFPQTETSQTTTDLGLKFVRQLKKTQDKNGRDVAIHFIDLPSRTDYPDYYETTAMPLSLNMIEKRLQSFEYPTLEKLEADLKRLVQNAKDYNHARSPIYEDAERIRKAVSNFMPKHNPAYQRPDYRPYPTPIRDDAAAQRRTPSVSSDAAGAPAPERVKLVFSRKRQQSETSASTPVDTKDDTKQDQLDFLQQLSGQEDAINFEEKVPKKDYPDYYKLIKKPTCISDVRTLVIKDSITEWDDLAREVRLIWDNAKEYNQEGSEIYSMAEKLETWAEQKMQVLGAPPRKNLKLSLSQPKPKALRLTMGSAPPTANLAGVTIDNESLRRQKEETSQALGRSERAGSKNTPADASTPGPSTAAPSVRRSTSLATEQTADQPDVTMADVNGADTPQAPERDRSSQTPAGAASHLPTPVTETSVPGSTAPVTNGVCKEESLDPPAAQGPAYNHSAIPLERHFRDPGQGLESALLGSVIFMTNPNSPNDPKWKLIRYADPSRTQTSGFISLPANYRDIRIIPVTTLALKRRRRSRVLFIHNTHVFREPNSPAAGAYDVRLMPGENVLSVEVLADLNDGEQKAYAPPHLQFDFEKCAMIVQLNPKM